MDYHALANDVVDETLKCELCCCILLRMGSRFTSSPQGRESSIKKGADFAFAFYGYRVYPLDEAYLFALRGNNLMRCKPGRCRAIFCKCCHLGAISFGGHAAASDQAPFCAHARLCRKMRKIRPACKSGIPGVWPIVTCVASKRARTSIRPWEWPSD